MSEPIISTKEQVGEYDAIETLKPGEPVFPLQGGDPFAPACIQLWVEQCRAAARQEEEDEDKRRTLLRKALAAEHVLWACQSYQRGEEIEVVERTEANEEAPDETRPWRAGLLAGTRHLREAAAQLTDAAEHLPADMAEALRLRVDEVNRIADEYEPKRASYGQQPSLPLAPPHQGVI